MFVVGTLGLAFILYVMWRLDAKVEAIALGVSIAVLAHAIL